MADSFKPLQPRASTPEPQNAVFRVKLVPTESTTTAPITPLKLNGLADHARHATAGIEQPTVNLVREGDRIQRIEIQCSCGQLIELTCQY